MPTPSTSSCAPGVFRVRAGGLLEWHRCQPGHGHQSHAAGGHSWAGALGAGAGGIWHGLHGEFCASAAQAHEAMQACMRPFCVLHFALTCFLLTISTAIPPAVCAVRVAASGPCQAAVRALAAGPCLPACPAATYPTCFSHGSHRPHRCHLCNAGAATSAARQPERPRGRSSCCPRWPSWGPRWSHTQ